MTPKRFTETVSTGDVHDTLTGKSYRCEYRIDDEFLELVNNIAEENEQLKKDRFICLDCEHSGYVEIGCLCEYNDHWQEHITECEDFKGLRE